MKGSSRVIRRLPCSSFLSKVHTELHIRDEGLGLRQTCFGMPVQGLQGFLLGMQRSVKLRYFRVKAFWTWG